MHKLVNFCLFFNFFSDKSVDRMSKELTILEAAMRKGKDRSTVLRWIKKNLLPNARLIDSPNGDYWMIPETDLENPALDKLKPGPKPAVKKAA